VRIGALEIDPPVVLAPMSGINDRTFRLLCREAGAGLVCTGLISANALQYRSAKTEDMLRFSGDEQPVCAQVFGAEPEVVAEAAAAAAARGAAMVDINMGCSVPKVLKARAGAALMADPERAEAMVRAVASAVSVPVGVKMRRGWRGRGEDAVALARRCEGAGAAAIAVHPRWVGQRFSGSADWSVIARVKEAVGVAVVGNGGIRSGSDAVRMVEETRCDGVMVGTGALGNPWIFGQVAAALRGEPTPAGPTAAERMAMAARHVDLVVPDRGTKRGVLEMRKHIAWYLRGIPMARAMRAKVNRATTAEELKSVLAEAEEAARLMRVAGAAG
jgi:nifR3 family TIM-barrel protein